MILGKVIRVSRRYLPPLMRYRENPAGGAEFAPLIGVRVKVDSIFEWICIDKHIYRRALSLCRQFAIKFFAAATLLQQRWRSGPPLREFHWIVTSSCWFNRRQTSNWRYLSELPPSCYCRPMNDTTDANIVPMVPTTQERLHIVSTLVNTLYMLFSKNDCGCSAFWAPGYKIGSRMQEWQNSKLYLFQAKYRKSHAFQ